MRALKRLSHRNWPVLRDIWISHVPPVDLEVKYPEPSLWQLPNLRHPPLTASGTAEFPYVDGVREAIFREVILLSRKFIYCCTLLPTLSKVGKNTWTAIAAYEACFYGAKAFCYLLGFASLGRDSKMYLDAFYETERRVGKERKKVYDTLRVHRFDDRFTHEVLWALTARLIDTTRFESELREIQTQLRIVDWDEFTGFRNSVMYDGTFWPLHTDMNACDLTRSTPNVDMIDAALLRNPSLFPPFAEEYFLTAALLKELVLGMFDSLAEIAPVLKTEIDAFDTLRVGEDGRQSAQN
jgi:hypothetical protein